MMRALWTASTGMKAQQTNVDTIANNISNVNTVGYKTQQTEFKSLLYQTLATETTSANGEQKPTSAQVGLGTRVASTSSIFSQGPRNATENMTDFALEGSGFFAVQNGTETMYTRAGSFAWGINGAGTVSLTTSEGYYVLNQGGQQITLPAGVAADSVSVASDGMFSYRNAAGEIVPLNMSFGLFQFNNPAGLEKVSNSLMRVTPASGQPIAEANNAALKQTEVYQGYLEGSNVSVADEMVNLIVAQRAYELNSKAITTSDEMLGQANDLKR